MSKSEIEERIECEIDRLKRHRIEIREQIALVQGQIEGLIVALDIARQHRKVDGEEGEG